MPTTTQRNTAAASERIESGRPPTDEVRVELEYLALRIPEVRLLGAPLFGKLRKAQGSERFDELLQGIRYLASAGEPAGVRLLSAFLDLSTMADRILPYLHGFTSSRRYFLTLHLDQRQANPFGRSWVSRLVEISRRLQAGAAVASATQVRGDRPRPGEEHPWSLLRGWLVPAIEDLSRAGEGISPASRDVKDLLRLEVDALEERTSLLAGSVDPFRVAAIQRLLPILSTLDSRIRDARTMISWIEAGKLDEVFRRPVSRALETMEPGEFRQLCQAMLGSENHSDLGRILERRIAGAVDRRHLADDVLRLQRLGHVLAADRVNDCWDNPLRAASAAVQYGNPEGLRVPVSEAVAESLRARLPGLGATDNDLAGVCLVEEGRVLQLPRRDPERTRDWPHGLPLFRDGALLPDGPVEIPPAPVSDEKPDQAEEMGASEAKKLVMNSLQTTSILLALLRNPKITAVPGLVAEVATRTRNPQIISVIAADRTLHSGFANRDVPLACLRNPSNVSVKVLRKFVHVKFVSKVDLKRLSLDRAGVRRELRREIDKYLEALA